MRNKSISALCVLCIVGSVHAAQDPIQLEPSTGSIKHAGHIYYNIATGEMVTTLTGVGEAQRPVDGTAGSEIWIVGGGAPCADFGSSMSFFFGLDNPTGTSAISSSPMLID